MRSMALDMKKRLHPRAVFDVKVGGEALDYETVSATYVLILLFIMTVAAGALALMILEPMDLADSFIVSLSQTTNNGFVGPYGIEGGFAAFSDPGKIVLSLLMWVGRLEIGTAIMIFTPFFWKEIIRGRKKSGRAERRSL
jgi:trk system potassium uptake protein TrkH